MSRPDDYTVQAVIGIMLRQKRGEKLHPTQIRYVNAMGSIMSSDQLEQIAANVPGFNPPERIPVQPDLFSESERIGQAEIPTQ